MSDFFAQARADRLAAQAAKEQEARDAKTRGEEQLNPLAKQLVEWLAEAAIRKMKSDGTVKTVHIGFDIKPEIHGTIDTRDLGQVAQELFFEKVGVPLAGASRCFVRLGDYNPDLAGPDGYELVAVFDPPIH